MSSSAGFDQGENLYSSPRADLEFAPDRFSESVQRELRAVVGPNADYYLKKWGPQLRRPGTKTGTNWAAFFLSGFWFPYRKMYRVTLIFFAAILAVSILEDILFFGILRMNETPGIVSAVINLLTAGICGACANGWYLSHARQLIADARSGGLENEDLLRELSTRGGVSLLASLGTCFSLTAALAILLTIEGFVVRSF